MAPKKVKEETVDVEQPTISIEDKVKNLLKEEAPAIFDREPQTGFAEGNLNKLVADIINLFN